MAKSRRISAVLLIALAAGSFVSVAAHAQTSMPPGQVTKFQDTSMFKPPAGDKIAILEWEDLECPACARAFPIVHQAVDHYHIPLVRRDFMIPGHVWSKDAEIFARYLQDKVSPELATEYRREVFASQMRIASKDDLQKFTSQFMSSHGKQMPFVVDPTGQFLREVQADHDLGMKMGLMQTPTIIVVTDKGWIDVKDVMQLYAAIDQAEAVVGKEPAGPVKHTAAHR